MIGKRFKTNRCNWLTVVRNTGLKSSNRIDLYEIEFDEVNNIKYRCIVRKDYILNGSVKNPYYPSVCNVGYLGNSGIISDKKIYERWRNMIKRCYDISDNAYNDYGGKGVKVCSRWLCYENFFHDFSKIDGYDKDELSKLYLDKDIKSRGSKLYSLETCKLVSRKTNLEEMVDRKRALFIAISPNGDIFESKNQKEFSELHNLSYKNVNQVLHKKRKTHKGWKFYFKGEDNYEK